MRVRPFGRDIMRMLSRMGVKVEQIERVMEVDLILDDKTIKLINPSVTVMKVGGQKIYQIVSESEEIEERKVELEISEEDAMLVAEQAGVSVEEAKNALLEVGGDLAAAIILLKSRKESQ